MPPEFILDVECDYTQAGVDSKTTPAFNVNNGDLILAVGVGPDSPANDVPYTVSDNKGLTWTSIQAVNVAGYCYHEVWYAVADAAYTGVTVTFTKKTTLAWTFGGTAQVWRGHDGVGASLKSNNSGVPPTGISFSTTAPNSAVVMFNADWNASATAPDWIDNDTVETSFIRFVNMFALHYGHIPDGGAAGSQQNGIDVPFNQKYSYIIVEVKEGEAPPAGPLVDVELWENGAFKQTLATDVEVAADGVLAYTWDAAALTAVSGANVELRITSDIDLDVGAVEWNAYSAVSEGPVTHQVTAAGASTSSGAAPALVLRQA
ncbi:MAG TPA: hypothetical protein VFX80_02365, partial [Solirubrobacteraceae bacterium]|nr:hypothetical protein [Solirubrobacteraceae bacterium]